MTAILIYAVIIGVYASVVAALVDAPLRRSGRPTRFVWLAAMVVSVAAPVIGTIVRPLTARVESSGVSVVAPITINAPAAEVTEPVQHVAPRIVQVAAVAEERIEAGSIEWMIGLGVGLMVLVLIVDLARVARLRRRSREAMVDGVPVLISPDYGPAILGVIRPRIIVPEYFTELAGDERKLALEHELAHLRAHDGRLLAASFALVALSPWNLALWYQLARLRLAIEIDCDRTVLSRTQASVARYGALLVDAVTWTRRATPLAAGLSERRVHLQRRIEAMTEERVPITQRRNLAGAALTMLVIVAACMTPGRRVALEPPGARAPAGESYGDSIIGYQFRERPEQYEDTRWNKGVAHDLPPYFKADTTNANQYGFSRSACPDRLIDPRSGAKIRLITAGNDAEGPTGDPPMLRGKGVYRVDSAGRYGVKGKDIYLQVQCRSPVPAWMTPLAADARARIDSALRAQLGVATDSITGSSTQLMAYIGRGIAANATDTASVRQRIWAADQIIYNVYGATVGLKQIAITANITGSPVDRGMMTTYWLSSFMHDLGPGRVAPLRAPVELGDSNIAAFLPVVAVSTVRAGAPGRLLVPTVAIVERQGRPLIFLVRADTARWVYVTRGRTLGDATEILPDAQSPALSAADGDKVVVAGQFKLVNGMPVRVESKRD